MNEPTGIASPEALQAARDAIVLATLNHVTFDGWSRRSLAAGTEEAGFGPEVADRAFPGGVPDLLEAFSDLADREMLAEMERRGVAEMRVRDRIATGVRARLEWLAPHREAVRRSLSYLSLPLNLGLAARLTYSTVNAIWYAAGDESADFNFYTKRGLLAPVYSTTVLYWLADEGDEEGDFPETWAYLDRRLADVLKIPGYQAKLKKRLSGLDPRRMRAARRRRFHPAS
ncbi:MAG: COQ9 family protein [Rhodobacterales bacterium]|nr:COQ9 family protein [Rhodobacterales bacterium]